MVRLAAGSQLSWNQEQIQRRGAAIECRVCAEDPSTGFLPSPGRIRHLQVPTGLGVRRHTTPDRRTSQPLAAAVTLAAACVEISRDRTADAMSKLGHVPGTPCPDVVLVDSLRSISKQAWTKHDTRYGMPHSVAHAPEMQSAPPVTKPWIAGSVRLAPFFIAHVMAHP